MRDPRKVKESDITKEIRDLLSRVGIFHRKIFQTLGSDKGISDILGIYKGRFLAIEVKKPGGKPSQHQKEFLDEVNRHGGIGFVARSAEEVAKGGLPMY